MTQVGAAMLAAGCAARVTTKGKVGEGLTGLVQG